MRAPTLRQNGEHMITMRVEYTFGFHELVAALAVFAYERHWREWPLDLQACSKRQCEAAIYESFRMYGRLSSMRNVDLIDQIERKKELLDWATAEVARLYPSMRPRPIEKLNAS
jgi:hypothetical protein